VGGIRECLRYPGSAEFHPLMYLEGLAAAVERHGGKIYEGTKAWRAGGAGAWFPKGLLVLKFQGRVAGLLRGQQAQGSPPPWPGLPQRWNTPSLALTSWPATARMSEKSTGGRYKTPATLPLPCQLHC
jgi:hypothetical protein